MLIIVKILRGMCIQFSFILKQKANLISIFSNIILTAYLILFFIYPLKIALNVMIG